MRAIQWLHEYGLLAPIAQLLLATLVGFFFAERWQRWRQRRDFQYQTLVKFSELTYEMTGRLSELLTGRGRVPPEQHTEKRREMISRWTVFMSMRPEAMACYGRQFLLSTEYQGLVNALNTLRAFVRAPEPVPLTRFEPEQEKFLAYREAIVIEMLNAMRLISRQDHRAEKRAAETRVQKANAAAAPATVAPPGEEDFIDPQQEEGGTDMAALGAPNFTQQRDDAIREGVKGLFLMNGGGAVALLAFHQAIWNDNPVLARSVVQAIGLLSFGLFLAGLVHFLRYHTSFTFQGGGGLALRFFYLAAVYLSLLCFLVAMGVVLLGAWRLLPLNPSASLGS